MFGGAQHPEPAPAHLGHPRGLAEGRDGRQPRPATGADFGLLPQRRVWGRAQRRGGRGPTGGVARHLWGAGARAGGADRHRQNQRGLGRRASDWGAGELALHALSHRRHSHRGGGRRAGPGDRDKVIRLRLSARDRGQIQPAPAPVCRRPGRADCDCPCPTPRAQNPTPAARFAGRLEQPQPPHS